mmetsp:Transcript_24802/g.63236  ORF Transcript_24802/g.63236 Transcript_24802/m.63236 type:complete len:220 (-) Transcript_24802:139-798(-)
MNLGLALQYVVLFEDLHTQAGLLPPLVRGQQHRQRRREPQLPRGRPGPRLGVLQLQGAVLHRGVDAELRRGWGAQHGEAHAVQGDQHVGVDHTHEALEADGPRWPAVLPAQCEPKRRGARRHRQQVHPRHPDEVRGLLPLLGLPGVLVVALDGEVPIREGLYTSNTVLEACLEPPFGTAGVSLVMRLVLLDLVEVQCQVGVASRAAGLQILRRKIRHAD